MSHSLRQMVGRALVFISGSVSSVSHHVLLGLRFLLAILLRWMGRPATDSKRPRRGPAVMLGRIGCPENGSSLLLRMREKDHGASDFDLNRNELSHWEMNS